MKTIGILLTAIYVLTGCARDTQPIARTVVSELPKKEVSLARLPPIDGGHYRVDPYIEAAMELQADGKEAASQQLLALARSDEGSDFENREKIPILCRILFTQRPDTDFHRPWLGFPVFLGEKTNSYLFDDPFSKEWPLEPIEIVDEIPFAIVRGYDYEGFWESDSVESFVGYCIGKCDWSNVHLTKKSKQQKEIALGKLLSSPKWQRPLKDREKTFLVNQIE